MPEPESKLSPGAERMIREVGVKQDRLARARGWKNCIFSSIAILGVVGWSVAVPLCWLGWRLDCGSTIAGPADSPGP